jgi:hypothetical protein
MNSQPAPTEAVRIVSRFHAVARCSSCEWTAEMTGDEELEVARFLRALLLEHVHRMHHQ